MILLICCTVVEKSNEAKTVWNWTVSPTLCYVEVWSKEYRRSGWLYTWQPPWKATKRSGFSFQTQEVCCEVTYMHCVVYLCSCCVQDEMCLSVWNLTRKKACKYPGLRLQFERFNPHIRSHSFHFSLSLTGSLPRWLARSLPHSCSFPRFLSLCVLKWLLPYFTEQSWDEPASTGITARQTPYEPCCVCVGMQTIE